MQRKLSRTYYISDISEEELLPLKQKFMYRARDIELRLKILCNVEFDGKTLEVYTESIDGAGQRQGANKWPISQSTEIDIRVPIFTEMWREDRNEVEGVLRFSVAVKLPPSNCDLGALQVDQFELYIHDAHNDIEGKLAHYHADGDSGIFFCEDYEPKNRVRGIFFGYQPFGSFMNYFMQRKEIVGMMIKSYDGDEENGGTPTPEGPTDNPFQDMLKVKTGRHGAVTNKPLTGLEILIDSISDAFAISQYNAGVQFFFRIPSQIRRSGLETDGKSSKADHVGETGRSLQDTSERNAMQ